MRQRSHVLYDRELRAEHPAHSVARVIGPESMAMLHSSMARTRWRRRRAVSGLTCQIGVRTASTSALLTSELVSALPVRG